MKIAIRGEGPTDVGILDSNSFVKGPMVILIEKLECFKKMLSSFGFDDGLNINDFFEWKYIHKKEISDEEQNRKQTVLRGKKVHRDSHEDSSALKGFYNNSETFGFLAKKQEADIAIFFVDTDNDWCEDRYNQVKAGLGKHDYIKTGVPMIPVKISECWLMCCLSNYQNCVNHEKATTNQNLPNYPKNVCGNSGKTRHQIAETCDPNRINMPSFNRFKEDFKIAVNTFCNYKVCGS